ncbi:MAG: molybdenum cofactor guanylyltransferase [Acidimicrobiia bacterium]|nr:molybdenum cofactor guanylyltransferase [Actinomycetota bacterium]MBL6927002.1 molybdenum cofactor guanylyltransferase [Acidimicrobiia bacterium]
MNGEQREPLIFAGAVLAGGSSRRMGVDKALLAPATGAAEPLVSLAANTLWNGGASDVFVVGGDPTALTALGLRVVDDTWKGAGPLGGIITAMAAVDDASVTHIVVLPCDLLAPAAESVRILVREAAGARGAVAVPLVHGQLQWLHACWPLTLQADLQTAFEDGTRAPRRLPATVKIYVVEGLDPVSTRDVDRPEDLPWSLPDGG